MLNLSEINNLIDDLEQSDTSLSNIRNLSALYNVKSHIIGSKTYDNVIKELNDILPSYLQYIEVKRKYQMKEITEEAVITYIQNVCTEIKEFIHTLYTGTDLPKEREIIKQMIKEMR